jgi:RNA polymerase sigma-70 factor (ECF subfamily)
MATSDLQLIQRMRGDDTGEAVRALYRSYSGELFGFALNALGDTIEQAMLGWPVAAALERLTPEHRRMIRLAHFQGMTMSEIARRCEIPVGIVKSRTWYALRSLRLVLEEMGVR